MLMLVQKSMTQVGKGLSRENIVAETQIEEPKSPKISCMGRIKHKDRQRKHKKLLEGPKTKTWPLRAFFSRPQEKRSDAPRPHPKIPKRMCQKLPVGAKHRNICYSDEDSEDENEVKIPFSPPLIIDLKPRKEINLWKRRTMDQLGHLQVAPLIR